MPSASSNAATPMIVEETFPFALYSWATARVAEGSVGEASEPRRKLIGMKTVNQVAPILEIRNGVTAKRPRNTIRNAISASKIVINTIPLPNFLMRLYRRVPPTEKVINERAIFVITFVWSGKFAGITWESCGFNNTPARIYPVTFGNLIFENISPKINPVKIMIPTMSSDSILDTASLQTNNKKRIRLIN